VLVNHGTVLCDGELAVLKRLRPYRELVVQPTDPATADQREVAGTTRAKVQDGKGWLHKPHRRSLSKGRCAVEGTASGTIGYRIVGGTSEGPGARRYAA